MESLIETINELQVCVKKFKSDRINIPEIIVIGSQSSGKSSILERIIDCDILPKGSRIATRCPIILQLNNKDNCNQLEAKFEDKYTATGEKEIQKKLQQLTDGIKGVREKPIILSLFGSKLPSLTLVDLPGMIRNEGDMHPGSVETIQNITEKYASSNNSIILAVSAANVDLANSDSIHVARHCDISGSRTLNVITKTDLMDAGTDARNILKSKFLRNSLGTVLLVNRSQSEVAENVPMSSVKEREKRYLEKIYEEISQRHGIDVLVKKLVEKFHMEIKKTLPRILLEIVSRKNLLSTEMERMEKLSDKSHIMLTINKFIEEYSKLIHGDKFHYSDELVGGALISDILYNKFVKSIKELKIEKLSDKTIEMAIKNTTGNKNVTYSIEKAFFLLTQKESEKFSAPNVAAIEDVTRLLKAFTTDIIKEMGINQNVKLVKWLTDSMNILIDKKYKQTKVIIEDILRCEKNQIFCPEPNSHWFTSFKNDLESKETNSTTTISESYYNWIYKWFFMAEPTTSTNYKNSDIATLRKLINAYFERAQRNVIYNAPKWIQTFLVSDLITGMKETLIQISDKDMSQIFTIDPSVQNKFYNYKEEYQNLGRIENRLRTIGESQ